MSLADQASLLLIPSGYKSQKLYSIFPTNGVGDFDFSRSGSATRIAKNGLITTVDSNVPRLEYPLIDGVVNGCPSLLLEPQRSNLITYSEAFDNAYWGKTGVSETSGFISPDGTDNAFKLVEDTSNSLHYTYSSAVSVSAVNNNFSLFVKSAGKTKLAMRESNGTGRYASFDLTNKSVIEQNGTDAKIEELINGWFRISFNDITTTSTIMGLFLLDDSYTSGSVITTYQGDGTSGVYIYGAQIEQGSYPTSYIPTNGSAVTRNGETANGSGDASTFNDSEGVLMVEIAALSNTNSFEDLSLSDGTSNNKIQFFLHSTNSITARVTVGGSTQYNRSYLPQDITTFSKYAIKYKANDFSLYVNGIKQNASTSGSIFPSNTLDELIINDNNISDFNGKVKQLQYYNSALTESELEQLTSWTSFTDMAEGQLYTIE